MNFRTARSTTPLYLSSDLSVKLPRSVSDKHVIPVVNVFDDLKDYLSDSGRGRTNDFLLDSCRSYVRGIELIDIEGPRREILEAF